MRPRYKLRTVIVYFQDFETASMNFFEARPERLYDEVRTEEILQYMIEEYVEVENYEKAADIKFMLDNIQEVKWKNGDLRLSIMEEEVKLKQER